MKNSDDFEILLYIASKGGAMGTLQTKTAEIAQKFGLSQQSGSRKLCELVKRELITARVSKNGYSIGITENGHELLKHKYVELMKIFSKEFRHEISGEVVSGLGEGKYYTSIDNYKKQFDGLLGAEIFPGTLNLKVDEDELLNFLAGKERIYIGKFSDSNRSYGSAECYRVKMNEIDSLIVIPERAYHPKNIIEIIAPVCIREKLNVHDGSRLTLS